MKIAMPVNGINETNLADINTNKSFGRAPYFLIYDIESQEATFLQNSAADNPSGAGIKAAQIIVDQRITALLTPRCGENAANILHTAGITLYQTIDASAEENINAFILGNLLLLEDIHPGFHG
ncbi:MAG TPA: dinitrogenase iron-molybdenum cofactor biosynthesis protein [Clostridiaceae bacterium]|nr:dinitrogenase iron-molybdenum cofactor biosynthesis protein [Clostridiaceae bacterium]